MSTVSVFLVSLSLCLLQLAARAQMLHKSESFRRLEYMKAAHNNPKALLDAEKVVHDQLHRLKLFWGGELPNSLNSVGNISDACMSAYGKVANATDDGYGLSLLYDMLDAWGKPGAGYLDVNPYAYGSFDECLGSNLLEYCIGTVNVRYPALPFPLTLQLAMCIPKGCTPEDVETAINTTSNGILHANASTFMCTAEQTQPFNAGAIVMFVVIAIFIAMVIGATAFDFSLRYFEHLYANEVHIQDPADNDKVATSQTPLISKGSEEKKTKPQFFDLITAFSLYKTVPVVLSTKQPSAAVTCLNGLRAISMFWVILGHTHNWMLWSGLDNVRYILFTVSRRFSYQAILNAYFSVDTFFFLSGLLVAYLTLRDMNRRKPGFGRFPFLMYYIHRFLRLTPGYAFVLFGFWFLGPHLGNGPLYNEFIRVGSANYNACVKYWWTNLLYINNLYPWKLADECMGWTWYLANDMQFYIVAPLMIIPLFVNVAFGLAVVGVFLVISFAITAGLTVGYNFQTSQFSILIYNHTENDADHTSNDLLYIKPYHRIMTYLVGIILGYLVYRRVSFPFAKMFTGKSPITSRFSGKFPIGHFLDLGAYLILWIIAAVTCLCCLYGLYPVVSRNHPSLTPQSVNDYIPSTAENVFYLTFSRFAWGVGLALLVFCCHNGYGGWINTFLSWGVWVPMSRLTFMAYLIHPLVLTPIFFGLRAPIHYNDTVVAAFAVANVVLSFGAAFVLAVFVEFPLGNLEMAVFKLFGVQRRESARHGTEADVKNRNRTVAPLKATNYSATKNEKY